VDHDQNSESVLGNEDGSSAETFSTSSALSAPSPHWPVRGPREPISKRALAISAVAFAVVALLVGLAVGGVFGKDSPSTNLVGSTSTISTNRIANDIGECKADARTIETAVAAYDADPPSTGIQVISKETGITPGVPSTYGHGTMSQTLVKTDYLTAWPSDTNGYAISLSTTLAGAATVYVPATSSTSVSFDYESSTSGCNAI
jgi:hypothetical protein